MVWFCQNKSYPNKLQLIIAKVYKNIRSKENDIKFKI